jgi:hypothetical protein
MNRKQPRCSLFKLFTPLQCTQWCTKGREGGGGLWCSNPPPKFRSFDKAEPNFQFRGKYIHNNLIRIWVSLILQIERNPWLGGYCPHIPVLSALCPQLNLLSTPPHPKQNSWVCHWVYFAVFLSIHLITAFTAMLLVAGWHMAPWSSVILCPWWHEKWKDYEYFMWPAHAG